MLLTVFLLRDAVTEIAIFDRPKNEYAALTANPDLRKHTMIIALRRLSGARNTSWRFACAWQW